jgi:hypothetical protein
MVLNSFVRKLSAVSSQLSACKYCCETNFHGKSFDRCQLKTDRFPLLLQFAANLSQRRPSRIFHGNYARTFFFVQILAAMQAQTAAVIPTGNFQWQRQQNLLAQNVIEQNAIALIIADLGFRVGYRELISAGIGSERAIEQLELARYVLLNWFQTPCALQLEPGRQSAFQPYVLDYQMLAVVLLDDLGVPRRFQRGSLDRFAPQVNDIGLKLLLKIERMKLQLFDVEEHCETSAPL